jgi:two-component system sensor histidine kinase KdpD
VLAAQRRLAESAGGTYHQLADQDIPAALLAFAHAHNATQLVLGATPPHLAGRAAARSQNHITGHPPRRRTRRAHRHLHTHRQRRPERGV